MRINKAVALHFIIYLSLFTFIKSRVVVQSDLNGERDILGGILA